MRIIFKFLFLSGILLMSSLSVLFAQTKISGQILDINNQSLPLANVILTDSHDSLKVLYGKVTDMNGNFAISDVKPGNYYLRVSFLGYRPYRKQIQINDSANVRETVRLTPSSKALADVEVRGRTVSHDVGKTTFTVTKSEKESAETSFGLLKKIPRLWVDEVNSTVTTAKGGRVQILVNGVESSILDLKSINPKQVVKMEYYQVPPARFLDSGVKSVVNIITRNAIEGGGGTLSSQVSPVTGYSDNFMNFRYNKKRSQFSIFDYLSYRSYDNKTNDDRYVYSLNNVPVTEQKTGQPTPFSYTTNTVQATYVNQHPNDYVLQFRAGLESMIDRISRNQLFNRQYGTDMVSGKEYRRSIIHELNPHMNAYFIKHFSENRELIVNATGSYFDDRNRSNGYQIDNADSVLYSDHVHNRNKNAYVVSQLEYATDMGKARASVGMKYKYNQFRQSVDNSFLAEQYTYHLSHASVYGQLSGKWKAVSYQIGASVANDHFSKTIYDNGYSFWRVIPSLQLNYSLNDKNWFDLNYNGSTQLPSLTQLSQNSYYINSDIIYEGNPDLNPSYVHAVTLSYSYARPHVYISAEMEYDYSHHPIVQYYQYAGGGDLIIRRYGNQGFNRTATASVTGRFVVFRWFDLGGTVAWYRAMNDIDHSFNALNGLALSGGCHVHVKQFDFFLQAQNRYKTLDDQYITKHVLNANALVRYNLKHFKLSAGMLCPFSDSWRTDRYTVKRSIVENTSSIRIHDNGRMLYFKLVYNFAFGRKYKEEQKKVKDANLDSGTLRIN
jgi:hypothetical protein